MYKCAKTLMYLALFVVIPTLLSACGGASQEVTTTEPNSTTKELETSNSSVTNKFEVSNNSTSVAVVAISSLSFSSVPQNPPSNIGADAALSTSLQLQLFRLSEDSITLVWDSAAADAGISHYEISRNGKFIARVDYPSSTLLDQGLAPYTNYDYVITAFDLSGKESRSSQIFTLRTLATSSEIPPSANVTPNIASADSKSSDGLSSVSSKPNASSKSNVSSKSSSSLPTISSKSSSSRVGSSSSKSSVSSVATVTISWNHPTQRESGTFLELNEIGGYEIRYRKPTEINYTYVTLNGNQKTEYTFSGETKDLEFEIAVFDTNGIYSQFVKVTQ